MKEAAAAAAKIPNVCIDNCNLNNIFPCSAIS